METKTSVVAKLINLDNYNNVVTTIPCYVFKQ